MLKYILFDMITQNDWEALYYGMPLTTNTRYVITFSNDKSYAEQCHPGNYIMVMVVKRHPYTLCEEFTCEDLRTGEI